MPCGFVVRHYRIIHLNPLVLQALLTQVKQRESSKAPQPERVRGFALRNYMAHVSLPLIHEGSVGRAGAVALAQSATRIPTETCDMHDQGSITMVFDFDFGFERSDR